MAKRKKHTAKRRHYPKHTTHRRRRRMSAGRGMGNILSNPIVGGIVGGLAGIFVTKQAGKLIPASATGTMKPETIGAVLPLVGAWFLRKKFPALSAGMASGAGATLIASKVPFLQEDMVSINEGNAYFADAEVLNEEGQPLQISDGELSEMLSEVLSDYGQIHSSTI